MNGVLCVLLALLPLALAEEERRVSYRTKIQKKAARLEKFLAKISDALKMPEQLRPEPWCKAHRKDGNVIIAAAMNLDWGARDAVLFLKSLRATGYKEDIVVPVLAGSSEGLISTLKEYDAIVYSVKMKCDSRNHFEMKCTFEDFKDTESFSINMMRFYLYKWLATAYSQSSLVMISDFRDVMFQSNPFDYKRKDWAGTSTEPKFVAFQEAYPNKAIYRCPFNGGWVQSCYGQSAIDLIGGNTVSCSGVSIGTRDAVIAYAYIILQQLNPEVRWGKGTAQTNQQCMSLGMDQGFHNWVLYSGSLERFMDLKIYQQGEGPVNTVGSFYPGPNAVLKMPLETWRVLRGPAGQKAFYNWNNDISPVVHQMDRFLDSEFEHDYTKHLKFAVK